MSTYAWGGNNIIITNFVWKYWFKAYLCLSVTYFAYSDNLVISLAFLSFVCYQCEVNLSIYMLRWWQTWYSMTSIYFQLSLLPSKHWVFDSFWCSIVFFHDINCLLFHSVCIHSVCIHSVCIYIVYVYIVYVYIRRPICWPLDLYLACIVSVTVISVISDFTCYLFKWCVLNHMKFPMN